MKRLAPVRLCEPGLPSCGALRSGAAQKVLQRREHAFMQSPESIAEILALKVIFFSFFSLFRHLIHPTYLSVRAKFIRPNSPASDVTVS